MSDIYCHDNDLRPCRIGRFSSCSEFTLVRELSRGGQGITYLARLRNGRNFVLKSRHCINLEKREPAFREFDFMNLCQGHKNIVTCEGYFLDYERNLLCTVLEYAEGGDLKKEIRRKNKLHVRFSDEEIWSYSKQLIEGLSFIHSKFIVHRDIAPGNLLLYKNGTIKIADFGISKYSEEDAESTLTGTVLYLSPEILECKPASFASDVWALGVVVYEMLMLCPPFEGICFQNTVFSILNANYKPITLDRSRRFRELLANTVLKDPLDRATAKDLLAWTTGVKLTPRDAIPNPFDSLPDMSISKISPQKNKAAIEPPYVKVIKIKAKHPPREANPEALTPRLEETMSREARWERRRLSQLR